MSKSPEFNAIYAVCAEARKMHTCCGVEPVLGMPAPAGYVARPGDLWKNARTRMVILALGGASKRKRPTSGLHWVHLYSHGAKPSLWGMHSLSMLETGSPIERRLEGYDSESWVYVGNIFDLIPYDSL